MRVRPLRAGIDRVHEAAHERGVRAHECRRRDIDPVGEAPADRIEKRREGPDLRAFGGDERFVERRGVDRAARDRGAHLRKAELDEAHLFHIRAALGDPGLHADGVHVLESGRRDRLAFEVLGGSQRSFARDDEHRRRGFRTIERTGADDDQRNAVQDGGCDRGRVGDPDVERARDDAGEHQTRICLRCDRNVEPGAREEPGFLRVDRLGVGVANPGRDAQRRALRAQRRRASRNERTRGEADRERAATHRARTNAWR